jgi:RHS repeat-associated protein
MQTFTTVCRHRYTGKERDTESGNDYFDARYYSSAMGRFMSPDWAENPAAIPYAELSNPQSLNLYSYAGNNPLRDVDPDGHEVWLCADGSSNCQHFDDDQWSAFLKQQADAVKNGTNGGITISGSGFMGTGTISCGGQECGQAIYNQEGIHDETGDILGGYAMGRIGGYALGKAFGFIGSLFGRAAGEGAATAASEAAVDVTNLSDHVLKSMAKRGWTAEQISETVKVGTQHAAVNKATGGAATEFVNQVNGRFVVVDNATKQVLQVSGADHLPNYLLNK